MRRQGPLEKTITPGKKREGQEKKKTKREMDYFHKRSHIHECRGAGQDCWGEDIVDIRWPGVGANSMGRQETCISS